VEIMGFVAVAAVMRPCKKDDDMWREHLPPVPTTIRFDRRDADRSQ
jgi:hypothetical protein